MTDLRPLHIRVSVLASRFDAMASGARKRAAASIQDAQNAERDAKTLHDAAEQLRRGAA